MPANKEVKAAVESILKKKGVKYNEWKEEVVNKRKLEILSGQDKEWIEQTVEEESIKLVMQEVTVDKSHDNRNLEASNQQ